MLGTSDACQSEILNIHMMLSRVIKRRGLSRRAWSIGDFSTPADISRRLLDSRLVALVRSEQWRRTMWSTLKTSSTANSVVQPTTDVWTASTRPPAASGRPFQTVTSATWNEPSASRRRLSEGKNCSMGTTEWAASPLWVTMCVVVFPVRLMMTHTGFARASSPTRGYRHSSRPIDEWVWTAAKRRSGRQVFGFLMRQTSSERRRRYLADTLPCPINPYTYPTVYYNTRRLWGAPAAFCGIVTQISTVHFTDDYTNRRSTATLYTNAAEMRLQQARRDMPYRLHVMYNAWILLQPRG